MNPILVWIGKSSGIAGLIMSAGMSMAQPLAPQSQEENTNRVGGDITPPIQLTPGGLIGPPDVCAATCAKKGNCQSWTLVTKTSMCWLKGSIPQAKSDDCCTSGVIAREVESNTDRPGSDIAEIAGGPVNQPGGAKCQAACEANSRCKAWTFVMPKKFSPNIVSYGKCYLKSPVPAARTDKCCVSGVVDRRDPPANPK
jgi:hypothetical protein